MELQRPASPNSAVDVPRLVQDDGDLVVAYKPAGWLVHPAGGTQAPDLCAWIAAQLGARVAPCHRLDLETSGVVLYARTPQTLGELGKWFAVGAVEKTYLALVHGRTQRKGIVRRALDDARRGHALDAVTRWKLLEWLGGFSLLAVRPEHGRKHQIRRHLALIRRPVVGDARWGDRRARVPAHPGRLWLHAQDLVLPDGRAFHAPLPPLLELHRETLRIGAARLAERSSCASAAVEPGSQTGLQDEKERTNDAAALDHTHRRQPAAFLEGGST